MQYDYEYLKQPSGAPFSIEAVGGTRLEFPLKCYALYEDLRTIEDNYRLLIRMDMLLRDPEAKDLSNIELKIGLRSCAESIVQAICRLLEKPKGRSNQKKTNCIYTYIERNIEHEDTKQRARIRYRKLVSQDWYDSLKKIRDKRISHQESEFDKYAVTLIKDFLSQPETMESLIEEIKKLLEFCTRDPLTGNRVRYAPRSYISK